MLYLGLAMISSALFCDAIIGNVQEKEMKTHHASNAEIVLYSYSIGVIYIFLYLIISGDFLPASKICLDVSMSETFPFCYENIQWVLSLS